MATEGKQRNNRVLVFVGLAVAVVAGALTLVVAQRSSNSTSASNTQTAKVVFSAVDIPKGTKITQDMLVLKDINVDAVGPNAATDPTQVVNKFPAVTIPAGSVLQPSSLLLDANAANAATLQIQPLTIPDGHVALAIPTAWPGGDPYRSAELDTVGGLIQSDDHIDILIDPKGDGTVRYGFQDVHVLRGAATVTAPAAAGAAATTGAPAPFMVIEVPRAEAEQISFLFNGKTSVGLVKYVLRPRDQYGKGYLGIDDHGGTPNVPQPPDQPVTPTQFNQLFPAK